MRRIFSPVSVAEFGMGLNYSGRALDLQFPQIMGILNVTPDSFSDGGSLLRGTELDESKLCHHAESMILAGAAILDVGGESTRPGATPISESEELDRVLPSLEVLSARFDVMLSLDTSTPSVMTEGARLGAGMINDVRALRRPGAVEAAAKAKLPVCLAHMAGEPGSMQNQPSYDDVVTEVMDFLIERVDACQQAGINRSSIILDPGFGFGKTAAHNFTLLRELRQIVAMGFPVLVGLSRKSMITHVINRPLEQRVSASTALALIAAQNGARLIRVHDVPESADALAMLRAVETLA